MSPLAVFLTTAIICGTLAWRLSGTPLFPGGDEPHYLVITQSLLHDGDLKIEDNYSIRPVGLPILALPAFAAAGYRGVVAMLVAMAALAAALLWRWIRETTGSADAATFAWAAVALTTPYLFNLFTVYPEIPGALAVMAVNPKRVTQRAADVEVTGGEGRSFLKTTPPFITNLTRSISVISVSGFPETPTRSANLPFSTLPTWLPKS